MSRLLITLALILPTPAFAEPASICFQNATGGPLFLVLETDRSRISGRGDAGTELCVPGPGPATIGAYLDDTVFEGCARRIAGGRWRIDEYQGVDLCLWSDRQ